MLYLKGTNLFLISRSYPTHNSLNPDTLSYSYLPSTTYKKYNSKMSVHISHGTWTLSYFLLFCLLYLYRSHKLSNTLKYLFTWLQPLLSKCRMCRWLYQWWWIIVAWSQGIYIGTLLMIVTLMCSEDLHNHPIN